MNEETEKEKPLQIDREAYWAENGRLYLEGPKSREIAMKLGQPGLNVGRNLREIKKRWARAATRQDAVLNQTQCATVYCEAMGGWQWSQNPKTTTTEENKIGDKSGESARSVIRSEQGPGDKTFLTTAVGAESTPPLCRRAESRDAGRRRPVVRQRRTRRSSAHHDPGTSQQPHPRTSAKVPPSH